jgi:hypothetical protein
MTSNPFLLISSRIESDHCFIYRYRANLLSRTILEIRVRVNDEGVIEEFQNQFQCNLTSDEFLRLFNEVIREYNARL